MGSYGQQAHNIKELWEDTETGETMRPLTSIQVNLGEYVRKFLSHRGIQFSEKIGPMGGNHAKEQPEVYLSFDIHSGHKIFIYEDGQSEIMHEGKDLLNLEIEDFDSLQELYKVFFEKLTEIFGSYPG